MKTWLLLYWDKLNGSFWFMPAVMMLGGAALAVGMLRVDTVVQVENHSSLGWLETTAPAARSTLTTLVGGLVTFAGVVFSITMLTLAQTSSQFGSRLLRTFMSQTMTQMALGTFLATSLYCLLVLRVIRELSQDSIYVPHLSIGTGVFLAIVNLVVFVAFIHHMAVSIQAQTVVRSVAHDLDDAIDRLYPESIGSRPEAGKVEFDAQLGETTGSIASVSTGYLQAIDGETLLELAGHHDLCMRIDRRPGDFLSSGMPICRIEPPDRLNSDIELAIAECFLTGHHRTPRQDVGCAIIELVEVAVRALSPGVNDPFTAMACIDYLGHALSRLATREIPSAVRLDPAGQIRIIAKPSQFGELLDAAFDQIRHYSRDSAAVTLRIMDALMLIAGNAKREQDRREILHQAETTLRSAEAHFSDKAKASDVERQYSAVEAIVVSAERHEAQSGSTHACELPPDRADHVSSSTNTT